jgi:hypothetical protein
MSAEFVGIVGVVVGLVLGVAVACPLLVLVWAIVDRRADRRAEPEPGAVLVLDARSGRYVLLPKSEVRLRRLP